MLRREARSAFAAAFALGVATSLALSLSSLPAKARVQRAEAGGALAVAFADARNLLARSLLMKADEYFHGGLNRRNVKLLCKDKPGHDHDGHGHDEHGEGCHCHDCEARDGSTAGRFDPWAWIANGIDAPTQHRHLEQQETAEMLPLIWAAARADPGNEEAWSTAWFVLHYYIGRKDQALKVLDEALERNPQSVEMRFLHGESAWDVGRGDRAEAEKWFSAARDTAFAKCGGDVAKLSEADAHHCRLSLTMLTGIARDRDDLPALERLKTDAARMGEDKFSYTGVTNAIRMVRERLAGKGETR